MESRAEMLRQRQLQKHQKAQQSRDKLKIGLFVLLGIVVGGGAMYLGVSLNEGTTTSEPVSTSEDGESPGGITDPSETTRPTTPQDDAEEPEPPNAGQSSQPELEAQLSQQATQIELLRAQIESMSRRDEPPPVSQHRESTGISNQEVAPEDQQPAPDRSSRLEEMEEIEREWRPVFAEYKKRYKKAKDDYDLKLKLMRNAQDICNDNNVGESDTQQGITIGDPMAGSGLEGFVQYGNCNTIDSDVRDMEREKDEHLRDIQRECYDDAVSRHVSIAKAKLR